MNMSDMKEISSEETSRNVSAEYKHTAARVLLQLEKSLGKDLDESEKFMFVHGTAECQLPENTELSGKCSETCDKFRGEADEAIEKKNEDLESIDKKPQEERNRMMMQAVRCLNRAVMLAPAGSSQLVETLFHRSRLLSLLHHNDAALRQEYWTQDVTFKSFTLITLNDLTSLNHDHSLAS